MQMSRNEDLVYQLLEGTSTPMSAYDILDALRPEGLRAPLQVYRALNKLIDRGAVHRIESINAFVACSQHDCGSYDMSIFMLCTACETAHEFTDPGLAQTLDGLCNQRSFTPARKLIEMTGICQNCQAQAGSQTQP